MSNEIPDHLRKNLDIVFVGFNPSLKSAETGHHYANPNNRFWKVLYESGLTPRKYSPYEDFKLLDLGYGFTNIVARPTKTAAEITKEEYKKGSEILREKLMFYRPRMVCFVGKGVYEQYSGRKKVDWGKQPEETIPGIIDFVAPSTSGLVRMKVDEMIAIYKELNDLKENVL
mgnify:FL=1